MNGLRRSLEAPRTVLVALRSGGLVKSILSALWPQCTACGEPLKRLGLCCWRCARAGSSNPTIPPNWPNEHLGLGYWRCALAGSSNLTLSATMDQVEKADR